MNTSALRDICQKGGEEPFLISKWLYRPFTIYFSRVYIAAGAHSNTVTLHSLAAGLLAAACAFGNSPPALLLAAVFIQIYFILDHVDGEVARYNVHFGKQRPSFAGEFFDLWTHLHTYNLAHAAAGIALYRATGSLVWPVLGLIGCNICGSYQRMALSSVMVGALGRGRLRLNDPGYASLLAVSHGGDAENKPGAAQRFFKLAAELVLFPGNLLWLTAACLGDLILHGAGLPPFLFRCAYLAAFAVAGVASKIHRTRAIIRELDAAARKDAGTLQG